MPGYTPRPISTSPAPPQHQPYSSSLFRSELFPVSRLFTFRRLLFILIQNPFPLGVNPTHPPSVHGVQRDQHCPHSELQVGCELLRAPLRMTPIHGKQRYQVKAGPDPDCIIWGFDSTLSWNEIYPWTFCSHSQKLPSACPSLSVSSWMCCSLCPECPSLLSLLDWLLSRLGLNIDVTSSETPFLIILLKGLPFQICFSIS